MYFSFKENRKIQRHFLQKASEIYVIQCDFDFYLPQNNDVFEQCKEHKYDASTHPNIQSRNIADFRCVLPERKKTKHLDRKTTYVQERYLLLTTYHK